MEILDSRRRPPDDGEAEAAAILGIDPPAPRSRAAAPAAGAGDVEAEAAAILGLEGPGRARGGDGAPGPTPAPAAPFAVSTAGPRIPRRLRQPATAAALDALDARLPRNAAGQIIGGEAVARQYLAALPAPERRTPYERALADLYVGARDAASVGTEFGDALKAEMEADRIAADPTRGGTVDAATGRPIDEDESGLEQLGRVTRTGLGRIAQFADEAAGQGLEALGRDGDWLDRAGKALQGRADEIGGQLRDIPIGRQTLGNREMVARLADSEEETTLRQSLFGRHGMSDEDRAGLTRNTRGELAGTLDAFLQDPGGTLRGLANDVGESAPTTLIGAGLTALNPAAGAAFYGSQGIGSQLSDAAHGADGRRVDVGARAGAAAVASGALVAGFDTFADKVLVGNVAESITRAGLNRTEGRAMLREIYDAGLRVAGASGRQTGVEGGTEGFQTVFENIGAKYGWAPERGIADGVVRSMFVGMASGGPVAGVATSAGETAAATRTPATFNEWLTASPERIARAQGGERETMVADYARAVEEGTTRAPYAAPMEHTLTDAVVLGETPEAVREAAAMFQAETGRTVTDADLDAALARRDFEAGTRETPGSVADAAAALPDVAGVVPDAVTAPIVAPAAPEPTAEVQAAAILDTEGPAAEPVAVESATAGPATAPAAVEPAGAPESLTFEAFDGSAVTLGDVQAFVAGRPAVSPSEVQRGLNLGYADAQAALAALGDSGVVAPADPQTGRRAVLTPDVPPSPLFGDGQAGAVPEMPAAPAPTPARTPAPVLPRRFNRGQRGAVTLRFADDVQAALYDYGSSLRARSGKNPTKGQRAAPERRAGLIARGIPEADVERVALAEYDAVRAAANAADDGADVSVPRLWTGGDAAAGPVGDGADTATPPPVARPPVVLTKAANARLRDALGLDALTPPERQTWGDTLDRVTRAGLPAQMEARAALIVDAQRSGRPATPLSADEHAALLVRLAELQDVYRELADDARALDARGEPSVEVRARALTVLDTVDMLSRASDVAGTEIGRALSIRKLAARLDGERFGVAAVLRDGEVAKGAPLTEAQRDNLATLSAEATAAQDAVRASETERLNRARDADLDAADEVVKSEAEAVRQADAAAETDAGARARREAARLALRDERGRILRDLAQLGYRANDVIGLTVEGAVLVKRLALNVAREGVLTLPEVVERVRQLLPGLSGEDVVRAIAAPPDVPADVAKARREAAGRSRALVSDAREALTTDADRASRQAARDARKAEAAARRQAERDAQAFDAAHIELLAAQARARAAVRAAQRDLITPTLADHLWALPNLARSVMTTGDMGAIGNQAAPLAARHPVMAARVFLAAWPAFFRGATAERVDAEMRDSSHQSLREVAGLYLPEFGAGAEAVNPDAREESFASRAVAKAPWLVRAGSGALVGSVTLAPLLTPAGGAVAGAVLGLGARVAMQASERHMVLFLNLLRASVFDAWADAHPDATKEDAEEYARHVNLFTGRGELSADLARAGSVVAFSPRLTAARFQAPWQIVKPGTSKAVRAEAALTFGAFVGSRMLFLTAASSLAAVLAGDDDDDPLTVGVDPRDSDFGKIVWGPLRIDVWGGYAGQARLFLRFALAGTDAWGFTEAPAHRQDIDPIEEMGRFLNGKKAPWIGTLVALWTGKGFDGKPVTRAETVAQAFTPMGIQTAAEAFETDETGTQGARRAGLAFGSNFLGYSADAYDDPLQSSGVKPFFERAQYRALPAPPDDMPEEDREAYTEDFRRRLAAAVRREARDLSSIAEPSVLKERLEALTRIARLEARGAASGDPLGTPEMIARFAEADYTPSPGAPQTLGDSARSAFEDDFRRRLAAAVSADTEVLDMLGPEAAKERLQDHARVVRETVRAEATGDPLAPVLETLQRADYRALPYAPQDMPEDERDAYRLDFNRRMARLVQDEETALAEMAPEDAKERLRSLAASARADARTAAGY